MVGAKVATIHLTMDGSLEVTEADRCIGCGLCVLWASFFTGGKTALSLAHSPILVDHSNNTSSGSLYNIQIDEGSRRNLPEIVEICPQGCFVLRREE